MDQIVGAIFILLLISFLFAATFWDINREYRNRTKRQRKLKELFGDDIKVVYGFPINQDVEEVIQGGLSSTLQTYRELIYCDKWLFIQLTSGIITMTVTENRSKVSLGLFSRKLDGYCPDILIRNSKNKSLLARHTQKDIKKRKMVWCEGAFDKDYNLYTKAEDRIDVLSILSPEVLEKLQNCPGKSDILIRRNQLYYLLPPNMSAEKILSQLLEHSTVVARELEENLRRWGRSTANQVKLEKIKSSELSVTLREMYNRGML